MRLAPLLQSWFRRRQLRPEQALSRPVPDFPRPEFRALRFRAAMNPPASARRSFRARPRPNRPTLTQPAARPRAQRIRLILEYRNIPAAFVTNRRSKRPQHGGNVFLIR